MEIKKLIVVLILTLLAGCSSTKVKEGPLTEGEKQEIAEKVLQKDRVSFHDKYGYPKPNQYISRPIPYLSAANSSKERKTFFQKEDEAKFLTFYKDLDHRGYGDISSYWRWNFQVTARELQNTLNKNLPVLSKSRPRDVFTYSNKTWVNKPIGANPVGTLRDIKVLERGKSGIITQLLIVGSKGTYLVTKEGNIRGLIKLGTDDIGVKKEIPLRGAKGGEKSYSRILSRNPRSLPSAFFAFEKTSSGYAFYGGGFGHGVGMPQWSAYSLGKNEGYSYKEILKKYYEGISFKDMYSLSGVGKTIRIGLNTTGFKSLDHDKAVLSSRGKMEISAGGKKFTAGAGEKVEITNRNGVLVLKIKGKEVRSTKGIISIKPSGSQIAVENIKRNLKKSRYPLYRGQMEVRLSKNPRKVRIINEVNIEDYLLQVVPSEMGPNFGLQALKAQAVAARTYALKDYLGNKYKAQGFHIDDSTKSQVYNNLDENEIAAQAVKETAGQVMLYQNKPIDAKYYSTTAGFGAAAHNVW